MVNYVRGPAYKVMKSVAGFNLQQVRSFVPDLMVWGAAAGAGVGVFTEGVPLFRKTFYEKIPVVGDYWVYNPDPEDVPV